MSIQRCPICGATSNSFTIDNDNLNFLNELKEKQFLNQYLDVCRINLDIIRNGAQTTAVVTNAIMTIRKEVQKTTSTELNRITSELPLNIQKIIEEKIPDPQEISTLIKVLPELTLAIHDALLKEKVPSIKGKVAERELLDELTSYFPEDEIILLGKSGETDIVLTPKMNNISTRCEVLIESKKNSYWSNVYLGQIQKHMSNRKSSFAVLAVETMPKGANGYFTRNVKEGTIFVTSRENCKLAYGAIRAVIVSQYLLGRQRVNLQAALKNTQIQESIKNAYTVTSKLESIRKHSKSIVSSAKKIDDDANEAEYILQSCLTELQRRIQDELESPRYDDAQAFMNAQTIGSRSQDD